MNKSEEIAKEALHYFGYSDVIFEPDDNTTPDFLIDGKIAVEVRVLNQNHIDSSGRKSLEEVSIPLNQKIKKLLSTLGPPTSNKSWFVIYHFRRPVEDWKTLREKIISALSYLKHQPPGYEVKLGNSFEIKILEASKKFSDEFVYGASTDEQAGGWIISELIRNIEICIAEKTEAISKSRKKYPVWWLMLVDYIDFSLEETDREIFREEKPIIHDWDKIILIDPRDPRRTFTL